MAPSGFGFEAAPASRSSFRLSFAKVPAEPRSRADRGLAFAGRGRSPRAFAAAVRVGASMCAALPVVVVASRHG